jgi:hypothetical protein
MELKHAVGVLCYIRESNYPENINKVVEITKREPDMDYWFGAPAWNCRAKDDLTAAVMKNGQLVPDRGPACCENVIFGQYQLQPFCDPNAPTAEDVTMEQFVELTRELGAL